MSSKSTKASYPRLNPALLVEVRKRWYTVQPTAAGPDSTNNDTTIITELVKKNQYESAFIKPEAISRAPICNGISRFEKYLITRSQYEENHNGSVNGY